MTVSEFLEAFASEVGGTPPTGDEADILLQVAAIAAHGSERVAAPLACWIGGASGRPPGELLEAARRVAPGVD